MRIIFAPLLAVLLGASPVQAAVSPDILKSPGRSERAIAADADRKPIEILDFYGVKPGQQVLDFLAGGGYYSELIAKAVGPKGSVYAFDVPIGDDEAGTKFKASWAALQSRNPNVEFVTGDTAHPALPANRFDFALLHLVYHDLYWEDAKEHYPHVEPADFLRQLYASMKKGALVGVVDHVGEPSTDIRASVDKLHRIDPAVVKADFEKAGFKLVRQSTLLMTGRDDHAKLVFDPGVRGHTDRFVYAFRKP